MKWERRTDDLRVVQRFVLRPRRTQQPGVALRGVVHGAHASGTHRRCMGRVAPPVLFEIERERRRVRTEVLREARAELRGIEQRETRVNDLEEDFDKVECETVCAG